MKLGFALPTAGAWSTPENQVQIAQKAESLGYDSLWVFHRLLRAHAPQNDYPPMPGQPWPEVFGSASDPIVTLAYIAGVTSTIRLGTSVLIMPYYTPVVLAKELATLDRVSGGRLDVGLGVGWSMDEFDSVGVPYNERGRRGNEFLECLKAIWTQEAVEFNGEFYRVPKSTIEPKPTQKPHPPITIGGYGPPAIKRTIRYGDGFIGGNMPLADVTPLIEALKSGAEEAGRDFSTMQVVSRGSFRLFDSPQGAERRPLWGTLDEIREDIDRYAEAGLTELFLEGNFSPDITMETALGVMEAMAPASN